METGNEHEMLNQEKGLTLVKLFIVTTGRHFDLISVEIQECLECADIELSLLQFCPSYSGKRRCHSCLLHAQFTLGVNGSLSQLKQCLSMCVTVRAVYFEPILFSMGLKGFDLSNISAKFTDVRLVGRKMNASKKCQILNIVNSTSNSRDRPDMELHVLGDFRLIEHSNEQSTKVFGAQLFCEGADILARALEGELKSTSTTTLLAGACSNTASFTTTLDFLRCYLSASFAKIGVGDLVLDPFAGSGDV